MNVIIQKMYRLTYFQCWLFLIIFVVVDLMNIFIESHSIIIPNNKSLVINRKESRKLIQTVPILGPPSSQSPCVISKRLFLLLLLPKALVYKCCKFCL